MGFAGNVNAEEAVEFTVAAGVQRVLPMHDDMFAQNIDPNARARFFKAAAAADIEVVCPPVGEPYFHTTYLQSIDDIGDPDKCLSSTLTRPNEVLYLWPVDSSNGR